MATGTGEPPHRWSTRRHEVEGRGRSVVLPDGGETPIVRLLRPLVWLVMQSLHRVRFAGFEKVPRTIGPEGLVLVSNHSSLVDPLILQALCVSAVRWMMDASFMSSRGGWFWRATKVIPVSFGPGDAEAFADAVAHVRSGGVLGVFPEGGLPRPPCEIRPFLPGVGAIVARTKAPVLLVWVNGGPRANGVLGSILTRSEITVTTLGVIRFEGREARDIEGITRRLRAEIARASGWPINDEPLPHMGNTHRLGERHDERDGERHGERHDQGPRE